MFSLVGSTAMAAVAIRSKMPPGSVRSVQVAPPLVLTKNAAAEVGVGGVVGLTGCGVEHQRIGRRDGDGSRGERALRISEGSPVPSAVGGHPYATSGGRDVDRIGDDRMSGDPGDSPAENKLGVERSLERSRADGGP